MHDLIAVFDQGKTHARLLVAQAQSGTVVHEAHRVNTPIRANGLRQLDLAGLQAWLLASLAAVPGKQRITAFVPVGHGAACVLLDRRGQVLAAPDYEDACFASTAQTYGRLRDPFVHTGSPRLPLGLNLGAQLHHVECAKPDLWAQTHHILLLPQFWAWRLSGVAATEVSSLGVHTDLWHPEEAGYSRLAVQRGWCDRLPPVCPASQSLGHLTPAVVSATGLAAQCQVLCGLHDSNASWLAHRQTTEGDLTVISSGTWTVAMSSRTDLSRLQEGKDMLANVDVFGAPVPTARFMGGREYAVLAGANAPAPGPADLQAVLRTRALALPAFASAGGPFQGRVGRLIHAERLSPPQRSALATIYLALVTEHVVGLLGRTQAVVVDGPLACNAMFGGLLRLLLTDTTVWTSQQVSGTLIGALLLTGSSGSHPGASMDPPRDLPDMPELAEYRSVWRESCRGAGIALD